MEAQQSIVNKSSVSATITTGYDDDARAEEEVRHGLIRSSQKRKAKRKTMQIPPEMRDQLLDEAFPRMHRLEEDTAKALSGYEFEVLRFSLREVVRGEVKEKMTLLQTQLAEYHSVLEDVIAFKSRCEQLEQDKKDLVSLCREVCQVRDDKIALLEKELAQLRNEQRSGSSSDWITSMIRDVSDGQHSQGYYYPRAQDFQPDLTPPLTSKMPPGTINDAHCPHNYYNDARCALG